MNTLRDDVVGQADDTAVADALREAMIAELRGMGAIRTDGVAAAFRAVRRQDFTPGAPLEEVYDATRSVVTKRDEHDVPISSVSAPEVQAFMIEQGGIRPGMRVLEYGSGGYNAALLQQMVGPEGAVTTADIDPEVTGRARALLDAAGYPQVDVVLADAENGVPDGGLFDVIIVTFGAWDISPSWVAQLAPGGRLVVPLRMRGLTRSLALERDGDRLVSRSAMICGFVTAQGAGAHEERVLLLRGEEIALRFDDGWPTEHPRDGVLATQRAEAWSGLLVPAGEPFYTLQFWLATTLPGFCILAVAPGRGEELVDPAHRRYTLAAVHGDSFAYLVSRPAGPGSVEFGAHAFGPHGPNAAAAMAEQISVWIRDRREGPDPEFAVWPKGTADEALSAGLRIDKQHTRVTVSWPVALTRPTEQGE